MKKITINSLSMAGFLLGLLSITILTTYIDVVALINNDKATGWASIVNLNHNGFHAWRSDHVTQLLHLMTEHSRFAGKPLGGLSVLLIGTIVLLWNLKEELGNRLGYALTLGFTPVVLVLLAVGLDPVVIGTLAWIPLMSALSLFICAYPQSMLGWAALVFVGFESCLSANQAAPIAAAGALVLVTIIQRHRSPEMAPLSKDTLAMLLIVTLLPALLTAAIAPTPLMPRYPKAAHLIPLAELEHTVEPLVGPSYGFETIYRPAVQSLYAVCGGLLCIIAMFVVLFGVPRSRPRFRALTTLGMTIAGLVLIDCVLPEKWSLITPLASVSRVLPWGIHYSITAAAAGAAAWLIGVAVLASRRVLSLPLLFACGALLIRLSPFDLYHPEISRRGLIGNPHLAVALRSPSALLVRLFAPDNAEIPTWFEQLRAFGHTGGKDVLQLGAEVMIAPTPSPEVVAQAKLVEKDFRWSTRTGSQRGNEVLSVKFKTPLTIKGVELDPGAYFTDYPRGIRVIGGDCKTPESSSVLFEATPWQGALKATPRGAPYLSPLNQVRILFRAPATVECVYVYQTGRARLDWSVNRVRIIE